MENGGIFCYKQTVGNANGVAGDTYTWNELPERVLTNNTDDCGQVHGVAFLESHVCLVFTDVSSKIVKTFSLTENAVQCLAGTGIQGQTDGSQAELYQPTSVSTELYSFLIQLLVS